MIIPCWRHQQSRQAILPYYTQESLHTTLTPTLMANLTFCLKGISGGAKAQQTYLEKPEGEFCWSTSTQAFTSGEITRFLLGSLCFMCPCYRLCKYFDKIKGVTFVNIKPHDTDVRSQNWSVTIHRIHRMYLKSPIRTLQSNSPKNTFC